MLTNFGQQVHLLFKLHVIWSVDSKENHENGCHQRSDIMAKMHQIRFQLRPRPRRGSLQCSPRPQLDLKGLLLRQGEGGGRKDRDERKRTGKGEGEKKGGGAERMEWKGKALLS